MDRVMKERAPEIEAMPNDEQVEVPTHPLQPTTQLNPHLQTPDPNPESPFRDPRI
jgi:hypothetical protein